MTDRAASKDGGAESGLGLGSRLVVGSAVAAGALLSGFLLSRQGRRLVRDTFRGKRPGPLADRVLTALWAERELGRRRVDVEEGAGGVVTLVGSVATDRERARAVEIARATPGVAVVEDRLVLDPTLRRRRLRRRPDRAR